MKNPNGFGSVYKMKGRLRNPYRAVTTVGVSGMRGDRKTVGYFETKAEAFRALALFDKNSIVAKEDITLEELYDEWSVPKYTQISKQTRQCYEAAWRYIKPLYGTNFRLLRTAQMQSIVNTASATKGSSTIKNIKVVFNMLYTYASENDIVDKNYAEFIKLPKVVKTEKRSFSDVEIATIEKSDAEWADTILVLIYTGMRISEMLGLTRFSVDPKEWTITGGIKTDAGKNRVIPIHDKIRPIIEKWIATKADYLFNIDGKKISANHYRTINYYPALDKMGVRRLTPHECRHTFASLMAKAEVDPLLIKKIIGHAKYATTADDYTHVNVEELRKAMAKL